MGWASIIVGCLVPPAALVAGVVTASGTGGDIGGYLGFVIGFAVGEVGFGVGAVLGAVGLCKGTSRTPALVGLIINACGLGVLLFMHLTAG